MRSVFTALRRTKSYLSGNGAETNEKQFEAYKELYEFIFSGSYTDYSKKDIFLSFEGASDDIIAVKLNLTVNAVRKVRSRISNDAYRALGTDIFELIESTEKEKWDEALLRIKVASNNFTTANLFPAELINLIRQSSIEESSFEFEDCLPELNLLRWLSIPKMIDVMSNVDADRLNYILKVLDGKVGTISDRMKIANYFCMSTKELVSKYTNKAVKFPPKRSEVVSIDNGNEQSETFVETNVDDSDLEDDSFVSTN